MYKYKNIINLLISRYGVVTISDFKNIKTNNIRKYLNRLVQKGELINIKKGLFYRTNSFKHNPLSEDIAQAIARKNKWDISLYGANCLNELNLTTQVPYLLHYASTGPSRTYQINGVTIKFNHCSQNDLVGYDWITKLIIQSIKAVGPNNYNDEIIRRLSKTIKANNIKVRRFKLRTARTITNIMERIYKQLNV